MGYLVSSTAKRLLEPYIDYASPYPRLGVTLLDHMFCQFNLFWQIFIRLHNLYKIIKQQLSKCGMNTTNALGLS